MIYLDVSKMSDTRQHDVLICKVQKYNVEEGSLEGGVELIKKKKTLKTYSHTSVTSCLLPDSEKDEVLSWSVLTIQYFSL